MIDRNFTLTTCLQQFFACQLFKQFRTVVVSTVLFAIVSAGFAAEANVDTAMIGLSADSDVDYAEANMVVETLHEKLLYIMQNAESLGYQGRYGEVQDVVTSSFDAALIAKVIMSRNWKELDETQQTEFIDLFKRLSVATYASRFDGYSGENFVELSTEMLKKGRLLIKTELQRPDDEPVKLDYLMHQKDGQWLIISVIANGVNDLSLKRAEYATVIKDKEFQGLVEDVASKITDMEKE
jgi:phospholipid transport system substrate-binding protein